MATIRNIVKSLICIEDLVHGQGEVTQSRNGLDLVLHKVDIPFATSSVEELQALSTTDYHLARVYDSPTLYVDYLYDENSIEGVTPVVGAGSWIGVAQGGWRKTAGTPVSNLTPKFIGEEVFDTLNRTFYRAYGTLNTEWA